MIFGKCTNRVSAVCRYCVQVQAHHIKLGNVRVVSSVAGAARGLRAEGAEPRTKRMRPDIRSNENRARSSRLQKTSNRNPHTDHSYGVTSVHHKVADSQFVSGERAVGAALRAGRRKFYTLYTGHDISKAERDPRYAEMISLARRSKLEIKKADRNQLIAMACRGLGLPVTGLEKPVTDGWVLECSSLSKLMIKGLGKHEPGSDHTRVEFHTTSSPYSKSSASTTISQSFKGSSKQRPFFLWLHGLQNISNVAAICRSALYFGVDGLIISGRQTADLGKSTSIRSAVGAVEYLPIFELGSDVDPVKFMETSQSHNWTFLASSPVQRATNSRSKDRVKYGNARRDAENSKRPGVVLVLGNEDEGLPSWIIRTANSVISIRSPSGMANHAGIDSLNVGAAAAILMESLVFE